MNTDITCKKTPHAIVYTIHGTTGIDMVHAWVFENGDINDKPVKKWISKLKCYVGANLQDLPDYLFRDHDIRKYHVDVWNEKAKNYRRYGKFLTNYELNNFFTEENKKVMAAQQFLQHFD
jgi:hypothetical protein